MEVFHLQKNTDRVKFTGICDKNIIECILNFSSFKNIETVSHLIDSYEPKYCRNGFLMRCVKKLVSCKNSKIIIYIIEKYLDKRQLFSDSSYLLRSSIKQNNYKLTKYIISKYKEDISDSSIDREYIDRDLKYNNPIYASSDLKSMMYIKKNMPSLFVDISYVKLLSALIKKNKIEEVKFVYSLCRSTITITDIGDILKIKPMTKSMEQLLKSWKS